MSCVCVCVFYLPYIIILSSTIRREPIAAAAGHARTLIVLFFCCCILISCKKYSYIYIGKKAFSRKTSLEIKDKRIIKNHRVSIVKNRENVDDDVIVEGKA